MIFFAFCMLILGVYSLFLTLTNISIMQRQKRTELTDEPLVSVCIPARNESENIERCVTSFLHQTYTNYEVLVLDDNSEDNTAEIVETIAKEHERVKLLHGKPLEKGWRGKVSAMKVLLEQARGDYILFTDADTEHEPVSIELGMKQLLGNNVDFVSGYPTQIAPNSFISCCIAIITLNTMLYLPLFLHIKRPRSMFAMAIGQYMLLKKQVLLHCGGLEKVKAANDDDVALARLFVHNGYRQLFCDMKDAVQCQMYPTLKEALHGLERGFMGAVPNRPPIRYIMPLGVPALLFLALTPLLAVLFILLCGISLKTLVFAAGTLLLYAAYGMATAYHGFSFPVPIFGGAVTFFCASFLLLRGLFHRTRHTNAVWKGRQVEL